MALPLEMMIPSSEHHKIKKLGTTTFAVIDLSGDILSIHKTRYEAGKEKRRITRPRFVNGTIIDSKDLICKTK